MHGIPVLDLTGESVARKEDAGCRESGDSNQHHEESEAKEEDSAEEIEKR